MHSMYRKGSQVTQRHSFNVQEVAYILRLLNDREYILDYAAGVDQLALKLRGELDARSRRTLDRLLLSDAPRLDRCRGEESKRAVSKN